MPRQTKTPVVFLALSPAATATALGIQPARAFLAEVVGIVKGGVEKSGGHFEVPKAA